MYMLELALPYSGTMPSTMAVAKLTFILHSVIHTYYVWCPLLMFGSLVPCPLASCLLVFFHLQFLRWQHAHLLMQLALRALHATIPILPAFIYNTSCQVLCGFAFICMPGRWVSSLAAACTACPVVVGDVAFLTWR